MLDCSSLFFFFFKQKTAYEMPKRLEFRRVLFRSNAAVLAAANGRPPVQGVVSLSGPAQWSGDGVQGAKRVTVPALFVAAEGRSEERRVGKECRSRWSTDR